MQYSIKISKFPVREYFCSDREPKHKEEANKRWWVKHFTSSSYVGEHYGVAHVRILSLLTKVKESVNRKGRGGWDKKLEA